MPKFSNRSFQRLAGVHPLLSHLCCASIDQSPIDFLVLEGLRSRERQRELLASGASQTMKSRHLTGHAVDLAPFVAGEVRWDWPLYHQLAKHIKTVALAISIPVEWGGDWKSFKDGPHWQLPTAQFSPQLYDGGKR